LFNVQVTEAELQQTWVIKPWYLSAIEIIDTQVARRGRQYRRNPPPYKNRPTKKNRIYRKKEKRIKLIKTCTHTNHYHYHHHHHHPPTKKALIRKFYINL
jgi:hypothetical protein